MKILDAESMREVDRRAIEDLGIPSLVLMENAATGLVDAVGETYPEATSAAIFCGPGNNGGDGLAIARHLVNRGYQVEVHLVSGGGKMSGDARIQLEICRNQGLKLQEYSAGESIRSALDSACGLDLVIDALFGTGLSRPLDGVFAEWVEAINTLPVPCVAVDLPSGLSGSSAAIMGPHIQSELTVTFGAPKIPHVLLPAAAAVGDVVIADLGIPGFLVEESEGQLHLLVGEELVGLLPPRAAESHKGDYGHALIVAGSVGKAGAAILAARAAIRSGSGLVTVATPEPVTQTVDLGSVESMTLPLKLEQDGGLSAESLKEIWASAADKQALAVGPGLGTAPSTVKVVRSILEEAELPVVLDADGINAFAGAADLLSSSRGPRILTPHPGEMARLLAVPTRQIQADRLASVVDAARKTGSIVVLKGNQTLIAAPDGTVFVNSTGNPGMATGGTGDVLTGILTGLLSQGVEPLEAACLAVWVHGDAGDRAMEVSGQLSLSAGDILDHLPAAWQQIAS